MHAAFDPGPAARPRRNQQPGCRRHHEGAEQAEATLQPQIR